MSHYSGKVIDTSSRLTMVMWKVTRLMRAYLFIYTSGFEKVKYRMTRSLGKPFEIKRKKEERINI